MTKTILGMTFDISNIPDFGSMKIDKQNTCLFLMSDDIHKLNGLLTNAVCVGEYGADKFAFDTGDIAYVIDSGRAFIYEASTDTWYEQGV